MVEPDPIDREIDALLDVEPSPAFLARVRADMTAQRIEAHAWLGRWTAASAAVLVVLLAIWRGAQVAPLAVPQSTTPAIAALEPSEPIVIEPIMIAPLATADVELGEHQ
ncbi:MAG TPA: hypothetical protein VN654_11510 [Vicinamibacterales bacterium]|jgi:hypothetical protein|nr:hypothetical protein [Vicinamibacterales bacterium]